MYKYIAIFTIIMSVTISSISHAQSVSVSNNGNSNNNTSLQLLQIKNLINAIKEKLYITQDELAKVTYCNNNKRIYAPAHPRKNSAGCIVPGMYLSGSTSNDACNIVECQCPNGYVMAGTGGWQIFPGPAIFPKKYCRKVLFN